MWSSNSCISGFEAAPENKCPENYFSGDTSAEAVRENKKMQRHIILVQLQTLNFYFAPE